jgi:hypothetical protein
LAPRLKAVAAGDLSRARPPVAQENGCGFGDHHPNDGNPPRTGVYRSRLDRGQPIAREPVQQRIREAMADMSATVPNAVTEGRDPLGQPTVRAVPMRELGYRAA